MDGPMDKLIQRPSSRVAPKPQPPLAPATGDMPQDARRYARVAVLLRATATAGDHVYACEVLNISAGGALIRCEEELRVDGLFEIKIEDFPALRAEIVHTNQTNYGIAFQGDPKYNSKLVQEILAGAGDAGTLQNLE